MVKQGQYKRELQDAIGLAHVLIESVSNGVWGLDTNGNTIFVNSSAAQMLGYTIDELLGMPMHETVHHSHSDGQVYPRKSCPILSTLLDGQKRTIFEEVFWRKDGSHFPVEYSSQPICRDGEISGVVVVFQDISERKKLELKLSASASLLKSVIESAPIRIFWKDRQSRYLGCNTLFAHDAGEDSPEEMVGKDDFQFPWKSQAERYRTDDHEVMAANCAKLGIIEPQSTPDGQIIWLRTSKVPLHDAAGQVNGVLGIYDDITESKLTADSLERSTRLLNAIVRAQALVIDSSEHHQTFDSLLNILLDYSGSEYGLIGEVLYESEDIPYLKMHAITNIAWNAETRALYERHAPHGMLFKNLKTLFGAVITTEKVVISNDPEHDPRAGGLPKGHPSMHAFLGMPLHKGGRLIGMIGIANRAGGYDETFAKELEPLLAACTSLIESYRNSEQQKQAEESMRLASAIYQSSSEGIVVTDQNNRIVDVNPAFTRITGYALSEVRGKTPKVWQSGKHDNKFYQEMWASILNQGHWQGEVWDRRKDGELHVKWVNISLIRKPDGSVYRYVAQFSDITEKKRKDELIWTQANFDALTGLPNRNLFQDRLAQEIKKANRAGQLLALLFIDLDRFKEINDTLGHIKGDRLLVDAARRIVRCVRESDTVARLGGDEFVLILPEFGDNPNLERIAQHIIQELLMPFDLGGEDVGYISASIGITLYPNDAENPEDLLKHADQAMYVAKANGRNRFAYYTKTMQHEVEERIKLTNDLRQALQRKELEVYYQPIVELATGKVTKAEALLRWKHPTRGMVSPVVFIPLAEESGLIVEIGDWVFQEVVEKIKRWRDLFGYTVQVSINKSPVQFAEETMQCAWTDKLVELNLPGDCLTVEITEGVLIKDSPRIKACLLQYRNNGVEVSIDDFGTGFSSLSYLKKFDIDYLKIDRSFVNKLDEDDADRALSEAIIVMAHKLGIKTIAEGVEKEEQKVILARFGCDYVQGYLYSRPVPAVEFEMQLSQQPSK